jgi:uncharacterized repeat protein (TIGR03833 family)
MQGRGRKYIQEGLEMGIVCKEDQRTGQVTDGIIRWILTRTARHPHGIKVRLVTGEMGWGKEILS